MAESPSAPRRLAGPLGILRDEVVWVHIPRFLFRVKDRQTEEEARTMVATFGITDIEIRRDDTIDSAWLEDYKAMKTTYGLEEIQEYLEGLLSGRG
jgi:hypothetical protein